MPSGRRVASVAVVLALVVLGLLLSTRANEDLKRWIGWVFLPFFGASDAIEEAGERGGVYLAPRSALRDRIRGLGRENEELRLRLREMEGLREENALLRRAHEWRASRPWDLLLARVILREPANWWESLHIDAGSRKGVAVEDPVLTGRGLVGKVVTVAPHRSRVALLGDPACRVAARLDGSGHAGIVVPATGGGLQWGIVLLDQLPGDAPLDPGLTVSTSGLGGIFPRGIPVGRLIDGRTRDYGLRSSARVRLAEDPERVGEVWVLRRKGETE